MKQIFTISTAFIGIFIAIERGTSIFHFSAETTPAVAPPLDILRMPASHEEIKKIVKDVAPKPIKKAVEKLSQLRLPQSLVENSVEFDESLTIGKNYSLVKDVKAVAKDLWKSEMGEKVASDQYFVFFRPQNEQVVAWPVALDQSSKTFHPVSHILHIRDAHPELRQEVVSWGLKEYYYNQRMKFLSVESTPQEVIKAYHRLTQQGLNVKIEVLKDSPRAK